MENSMTVQEFAVTGARALGLTPEPAGLRWMYVLMVVPVLTDLVETGRLPVTPREWLTELVLGTLIALLVRKVRQEHMAVLALARSDALTGLSNRRSFAEAIEDECVRATRTRQPLSLVYIDLDNFKQINDGAGHDAGDRVLQQLGAAISHAIRMRIDGGFRIGGDEFAVLLPGTPAGQADGVVTRIRAHCAEADPLWVGGPLGISAGIVELAAGETADAFVHRADEAMYRHKQSRKAGGVRP